MKKTLMAVFALALATSCVAQKTFKVTLDEVANGSYTVSPQIKSGEMVKKGTILTIKSTADEGYVFDTNYRTGKGPWQPYYYEQTLSESQFTVNEDMHIGASFIPKELVENLNITQDVFYAQPGVKILKYDVFSPKNTEKLPCIVIIHGGAWKGNTEDVMRGLARELANSGRYVVFSINYRWIANYDFDSLPNKMYQIIEDVYGALTHISENAEKYGADASKIFITGDSAGGHLTASAINFVERIGDGGFGKTEGIYEFMPTYLPKGESVDEFKQKMAKAILGGAPSYAVFSPSILHKYMGDEGEDAINAVTPAFFVPNVEKRKVPQFLLRGTEDPLITDEEVRSYQKALFKAGQRVDYVQVDGASHAFFDWKPDAKTRATFAKYGKHYAQEILHFFDSILEK